jgi:hypothetical protein
MGWASAGEIFDSVAQGFIDGKVDQEIAKPVLAKLMGTLTDMDWDTESESRDEFQAVPWIEDVFFEAESDPDVCSTFTPRSWGKGRIKGCEECGWSRRIHKANPGGTGYYAETER